MSPATSKFLAAGSLTMQIAPPPLPWEPQPTITVHLTQLNALLLGFEIWAAREQDKHRITSTEMKSMTSTVKCTQQDYRTNERIFSEHKINPVVEKIINYANQWIQRVRQMDGDRLP